MNISFRTWIREFADDLYHSLRGGAAEAKKKAEPKPEAKDIVIDMIVNRPPGGSGFGF